MSFHNPLIINRFSQFDNSLSFTPSFVDFSRVNPLLDNNVINTTKVNNSNNVTNAPTKMEEDDFMNQELAYDYTLIEEDEDDELIKSFITKT